MGRLGPHAYLLLLLVLSPTRTALPWGTCRSLIGRNLNTSLIGRNLNTSLIGRNLNTSLIDRDLNGRASRIAIRGGDAPRQFGAAWRPVSYAWQRRNNRFGEVMYRRDAGGGGDCLFLAISAGLQEAWGDPAPSVRDLRRLSSRSFVGLSSGQSLDGSWGEKSRKEFRERLEILAAVEATGDWDDRWSPGRVLRQSFYTDVKGVTHDVSSDRKKAKVVMEELMHTSRWGGAMDVASLEEALDISVILLSDSTGRIYNHAGSRSQKPRAAYLLIYYLDDVHFEQAGILVPDAGGGKQIKSAFSASQIPKYVQFLWKSDCQSDLLPSSDEDERL